MQLHQMRYIREVSRQNLNVSAAAEVLHTSQPGVSKQIQLLEEELGLQIFQRSGKRLIGITEPGKIVLDMAERMLREVENIKRVGDDFTRDTEGSLTIATTHTQARYRLPPAIKGFVERYPDIRLHIHQGNPTQVTDMIANGEADIGIPTEAIAGEAKMAWDAERKKKLAMVGAAHLFPDRTTYLGVRRDTYLRGFLYDFIGLIAPHLNRAAVNAAFK